MKVDILVEADDHPEKTILERIVINPKKCSFCNTKPYRTGGKKYIDCIIDSERMLVKWSKKKFKRLVLGADK